MIRRDLRAMAAREHDLIIIGGGIHGAMSALAAARCGLSVALCEARDFGSGASGSSLRILHGGLRYLQTLDLPRFFKSVSERRAYAFQYPHLVQPLPCLMPLYAEGMKRAAVMRVALAANDLLSAQRNDGVEGRLALPGSEVLSREAALRHCRFIRTEGLEGAARWHDYRMLSSERILIETLHRAAGLGACIANYARITGLLTAQGRVHGVAVVDEAPPAPHGINDGPARSTFEIRASRVVNCTGSDGAALAGTWQTPAPDLFIPSLAFNLLLDLPLPGGHALAAGAPKGRSPVYFLVPSPRATLAGTVHAPRPLNTRDAQPAEEEIEHFLRDLRAALPAWSPERHHVRRVFAGLLPVSAPESTQLTKREAVLDHGALGGPGGFWSVAGIKYTTAPAVAEKLMRQVFPDLASRSAPELPRPQLPHAHALLDALAFLQLGPVSARELVQRVMAEEAVHTVEDLVLRRTNWAVTEPDLAPLAACVAEIFASGAGEAAQHAAG